jgi:hypothetical protein
MSVFGVVAGSALAVLEQPRWLALSLAGFLVRGGLIVLLIPLIDAPTTAALANLLGPTLVGFLFGGVSPSFLVLVGSVIAGLAAWLILGGLAGAALDLELIRGAAGTEDLDAIPAPKTAGPGIALIARWVAHLPTGAVLLWGASPLVDAVYQELIHPGDPNLPVPVRVILRVPAVVIGLAAAWALGEAVGGLAVRHLAWGASLPRAMVRAVVALIRPSGLVVLVATDGALLVAALLGGSVLGLAFNAVRTIAREGLEPWVLAAGIALLSIAWIGALWLLGIATAWRSTAWTFEVGRRMQRLGGEPIAAEADPDH